MTTLLAYVAVLAVVVYMLVEVWPAPVCLGVGVLVIAVSVFGLRNVVLSPVMAVGQTVGLIERQHGAMMVLTVLFAMFAVGVTIWMVYGGSYGS